MTDVQSSQSLVLALGNFPSEGLENSQTGTQALVESDNSIEVSQSVVLGLVAGRVNNPSVRAWTFTLDGHDFYVLRLGNIRTLIYDMSTGQWYNWGTGEDELWSAYNGINWVGAERLGNQFGSNVLVGSDATGALFMLDPNRDVDDSQTIGDDNSYTYLRRITAQLPARGYDRTSVYEVQLLGSIGDLSEESLNTMTLSYSDDRGASYSDAQTVSIPANDYTGRASWRSLGSFQGSGRIFRIEDTGSLRRVDSLTVNTD